MVKSEKMQPMAKRSLKSLFPRFKTRARKPATAPAQPSGSALGGGWLCRDGVAVLPQGDKPLPQGAKPLPRGATPLLGALLFLFLLLSCDRRPLELYYDGRVEVRINVDWLSRFGERPHGMTLMLAKDSDAITFYDIYSNNDVDGVTLRLEPGEYKLLIFNLSMEEYGTLNFYNRRSNQNFMVQSAIGETGERYRWDENVPYMKEPERMGVAVDTFTVSDNMVNGDLTFYDYREQHRGDTLRMVVNEVVRPMTTNIYVHVRVEGLQYMSSVEGQLTGMANSFLPHELLRREDTGYLKLVPDVVRDQDTLSTGWLTTKMTTLGMPRGRELWATRDSAANGLVLNFRLINGHDYRVAFSAGRRIRFLTPGQPFLTGRGTPLRDVPDSVRYCDWRMTRFTPDDLALEMELILETVRLPYAQPIGTSAFEAEVDPWADDTDVDVFF